MERTEEGDWVQKHKILTIDLKNQNKNKRLKEQGRIFKAQSDGGRTPFLCKALERWKKGVRYSRWAHRTEPREVKDYLNEPIGGNF